MEVSRRVAESPHRPGAVEVERVVDLLDRRADRTFAAFDFHYLPVLPGLDRSALVFQDQLQQQPFECVEHLVDVRRRDVQPVVVPTELPHLSVRGVTDPCDDEVAVVRREELEVADQLPDVAHVTRAVVLLPVGEGEDGHRDSLPVGLVVGLGQRADGVVHRVVQGRLAAGRQLPHVCLQIA